MQFVVFWQCMLLTAYPLAAAPIAVPVLALVFSCCTAFKQSCDTICSTCIATFTISHTFQLECHHLVSQHTQCIPCTWAANEQQCCGAAYGSGATQMVTEEALAEREAALEGDPGSDSAVKISMPQDASLHSAHQPNPTAAHQPEEEDVLESKVMPSAVTGIVLGCHIAFTKL